jgi:hypothetical protein
MAFKNDRQRKAVMASLNKSKSDTLKDRMKGKNTKSQDKRLKELKKEREEKIKEVNEKYDRESNRLDLQNEPSISDEMQREYNKEQEIKRINEKYDFRENNVKTTNYSDVEKLEKEKRKKEILKKIEENNRVAYSLQKLNSEKAKEKLFENEKLSLEYQSLSKENSVRKNNISSFKKNDNVYYYNRSSKTFETGKIKRIDNKTYSFPIYIVENKNGVERALTETELEKKQRGLNK